MYEFKENARDELFDGRTSTYVANKVGITRQQLDNIILRKKPTKKATAYCIVKACNSNAEIEDYFIRKGK